VREVVWRGQTYYVGGSEPVVDRRPLAGSRMPRRDSVPDSRPNR
jgi:hypothetical protein